MATTVAAPVMIGIESLAIAVGITKVVGCQAKYKCSLSAEKHKKIGNLACSTLNRISVLVSNTLNDEIISDEEYLIILLEFDIFTQQKDALVEKSKISLSKDDKEGNDTMELLRGNKNAVTT